MERRSYSLIEIKSAAQVGEERIIEGVATSFATDRVGDVVDPKGAIYTLPLPLLWQHHHDKPVGQVIEATRKGDKIHFKAKIAKVDEPGALKDRVDEAWQSVKAGLVRAVSIGFRVMEDGAEWMKETGGILFRAWEWLELSLVTIPANQEASIDVVRSLDLATRATAAIPAASGNSGQQERKTAAASGRTSFKSTFEKGQAMGRYSKQIEALRQSIAQKSAEAEKILAVAVEEGKTLLEHEQEEYDAIEAEIKSLEATLKRLEAAEARAAALATETKPEVKAAAVAEEKGVHFGQRQRVEVKRVEKGINFARIAKCVIAAKGDMSRAAQIASSQYGVSGEFPIVDMLKHYDTLAYLAKDVAERGVDYIKTAVPMGLTSADAYKPLVDAWIASSGEFIELLRAQTIIGRLPGYRSVPFLLPITTQTAGGSAQWVGEGKLKPVTALGFGKDSIPLTKVAAIIAVSEELASHSSPDVELLIRDALIADVRERLDTDFIDPAKTAVSGVSPASITNGVTPVPASGATWQHFEVDVNTALGNMAAANIPLDNLVFVMHPSTALKLSSIKTEFGVKVYPELTPNGGTLLGYPVVVSSLIPATPTVGGYPIVIMRYTDIAIAASPAVTVRTSTEASLILSDAPETDKATIDPVSMFQTNGIAVLAERFMNWKRLRAGSVQLITGAQYGPAVPVDPEE